MVPHANQGFDQDVAVQQHEAAHELGGGGLALLPQPPTAAHQLSMGHLHFTTTSRLLADKEEEEEAEEEKKKVTSFGQPTRLIACANHGNDVICA